MWLVSWLWATNRWRHPRRWAHTEAAVLPWAELQCWVHHPHFQQRTHSLQSVLNDTSLNCRSRLSSQQRDESKPERQWLGKNVVNLLNADWRTEDRWRDIKSVFLRKRRFLFEILGNKRNATKDVAINVMLQTVRSTVDLTLAPGGRWPLH